MTRQQDRDSAILECRKIVSGPFVCLDTETTSLDLPEACQIALVNQDSEVAETLVKPSKPIEAGATRVHGITNEMVKDAPDFMGVYAELRGETVSVPVVIYNAKFDLEVLRNSAKSCGILNYELNSTVHDAMLLFAKFRGVNDFRHGHYQWFKLGEACRMCNIAPVGQLHGAAVDAEMTRRLVVFMAEQKLSTEE